MKTIHAVDVRDKLNRAEMNKTPDVFELVVATLGSSAVVKYRGTIIGRYAKTERYRIKIEGSGYIRTFALCLVLEMDGREVIW